MAIPSSQSTRSESEMAELRPVMPVDLFMAAIEGNRAVLIRRLRLQPDKPTEIQVTIEASHSATEQIKTEHQTVQSELGSATRFGDTVLHLLVTKGHNELALMAFQRDVSLLKSPNKNLETPLHCAAKFGNEKVIHNLIQIDHVAVKDALEQPNENGDTALHVAAKYNNVDISLALMKLDPEVVYRVNNNMFSALNVAIDRKYIKLVQTMLEQDHALAYTQFSTGMFPVHLAASMGNKTLVFHLMKKYPHCAELLDPRGRNLFHYAAEKDQYHIFLETYEYTSIKEMMTIMNIAKDCEGNTPLHIASMKGHRHTMRAICENKMNNVAETILNKEGLSPLELSRRQLLETYEDISDYDINQYVKNEGFKFTEKWFEDIMHPLVENKSEQTQVIGLGSALITTVAFAAAFTIPGGYNQDHGTPILGRRYMFRAFILANAMAFIVGFLSLSAIILNPSGSNRCSLNFAKFALLFAQSSMVVAFGLGLYATLAPVCFPIAILLLVVTLILGSPAVLFVLVLGDKFLGSAKMRNIFIPYVVFVLLIFCLTFM